MKKLFTTFIPIFLGGTLLFYACGKNDTPEPEPETSTTTEAMSTQGEFDDIQRISEGAFEENKNSMAAKIAACTAVSHDSINKTISITFDSTACTDGKVRKGTINITYSGGKYRDPGFSSSISTDNFYVDGKKIEGTKTVTNDGLNADGNLVFTISVTNGKVTHPDGKFATWQSTRTREWTAGESTITPFDDVYTISGNASGINKDGKAVELTFTDIVVKLECLFAEMAYPVSGVQKITSSGKTMDIDWGTGSCDKDIVIHYNGKSYNKTLH